MVVHEACPQSGLQCLGGFCSRLFSRFDTVACLVGPDVECWMRSYQIDTVVMGQLSIERCLSTKIFDAGSCYKLTVACMGWKAAG